MKTHRRILIICLIIMVLSFPFVIWINSENYGKVYDIAMALLTSSIISILLELPNFFELKDNNRRKLYLYLYSLKYNTLFFLNNISYLQKKNDPLVNPVQFQSVSNISLNINQLLEFDENYYFLPSKNLEFSEIKIDFIKRVQAIDLDCKEFNVTFSELQFNKLISGTDRTVYFSELQDEINKITTSCNELLKKLDNDAPRILSKKQLNQWISDNTLLNNAFNQNIKS